VVLELKGKLSRVGGVSAPGPIDSREGELIAVLTGLGYSATEAQEALRHTADVQGTGTDEDRIRAALRYFAGH
jgi:Holliday junction resolvasome RuvABC DNA-binding subunit